MGRVWGAFEDHWIGNSSGSVHLTEHKLDVWDFQRYDAMIATRYNGRYTVSTSVANCGGSFKSTGTDSVASQGLCSNLTTSISSRAAWPNSVQRDW